MGEFSLATPGEKDRALFRHTTGQLRGLSVSSDMKTLVYAGERAFGGDMTVYRYDIPSGTLVDLNIPERLKATLDDILVVEPE